jgi:hypothetical protein
MGRDFMPEVYPRRERAAELYTKSFLTSIGITRGRALKRRVNGAKKRSAPSRRKAS